MCIWLLPLRLHSHSSKYGLECTSVTCPVKRSCFRKVALSYNIVPIRQNLGDWANHLLLLLS